MISLTLAQAANATNQDTFLLWAFIMAAAALGLLFLELLVPSGGLLGLLCGVAAIGSIIAFFKYNWMVGFTAMAVYAVITPILIVYVFKVWLHSPLARRMVLGHDDPVDDEQESPPPSEEARLRRIEQLRQLIGAEGISVTALRPVGVVTINGQRLDAMAESGVIEADTPVVVSDVYDNQIKVRPRAPA